MSNFELFLNDVNLEKKNNDTILISNLGITVNDYDIIYKSDFLVIDFLDNEEIIEQNVEAGVIKLSEITKSLLVEVKEQQNEAFFDKLFNFNKVNLKIRIPLLSDISQDTQNWFSKLNNKFKNAIKSAKEKLPNIKTEDLFNRIIKAVSGTKAAPTLTIIIKRPGSEEYDQAQLVSKVVDVNETGSPMHDSINPSEVPKLGDVENPIIANKGGKRSKKGGKKTTKKEKKSKKGGKSRKNKKSDSKKRR